MLNNQITEYEKAKLMTWFKNIQLIPQCESKLPPQLHSLITPWGMNQVNKLIEFRFRHRRSIKLSHGNLIYLPPFWLFWMLITGKSISIIKLGYGIDLIYVVVIYLEHLLFKTQIPIHVNDVALAPSAPTFLVSRPRLVST